MSDKNNGRWCGVDIKTLKEDIYGLLNLFHRIAYKRKREKVSTKHKGVVFKTSVVLIGRPEIVYNYGSDPYINYIKRAVSEEGIDTFYILSKGKINSLVAKSVIDILSNDGFEIRNLYIERNKKGEPISCICHLVAKNRELFDK